MRFLLMLSLLATSMSSWAEISQVKDESAWLARRGNAEVSTDELNNYLLTVPEEHRAGVMVSRKRVGEILNGLLLNEQIVHDAVAAGMEDDPVVQVEFERARQRVLIQAWMQRVGDNKVQGNLEQLAYEQYLINQDQFMAPESVDVTHLLISTKERPEAEARKMAEDLHRRITSGELDFDEAVTEYSEDPSKSNNHGTFAAVRRGQMVKPFEETAFAMRDQGSISPVVQTEFGFHIIRMNQHNDERPLRFDEIKGKLIESVRNKLASDARAEYQASLEAINPEVNEQAVQSVMSNYQPNQN